MQEIRQILEALRAKTKRFALLRGLAAVVLAVSATAVLWFGLDVAFRLEWGQRLFVYLIALVAVATVVRRYVVQPLRVPMTDDDLALVLEKRNPALDCFLISAVQFDRMARWGELPFSGALAEKTVAQAGEKARGLRVDAVFDRADLKRRMGRAAAALAACVLVFAVFPSSGYTWFQRNLLLLDVEWPRDTYLDLEGFENGRERVPRGEAATVFARVVFGERPSRAVLHFRLASGTSGRLDMTVVEDGRYKAVLENVTETVTVFARAGDGLTREGTVEVVERPAVLGLEVEIEPPAYTGRSPFRQAGAGIDLTFPFGTRVTLFGKVSKDLEKVILFHPPSVRVPGSVVGTREFTAEIRPERSGILEVDLEDVDGLRCGDPVRLPLRIVPDRPPRVGLRLTGIGEKITVRAVLPMHIVLQDDYGVKEAILERTVEVRAKEGPVETTECSALMALSKGTLDQVIEDRLEVEKLGLKPGMFLRLRVEAKDGDVLKGPNAGRSETFVLKVVTPEELFADMVDRQQEQRRSLEQLIEAERAIDEAFVPLGEDAVELDEIPAEDREILSGLLRDQRGVQSRVVLIAEHLDQILMEMRNNRLGDAKEYKRLTDKVIVPLRMLASERIEENLDRLKEVLRARGKDDRRAVVDAVSDGIKGIVRRMHAILQNMLKQESLSEIIAVLRSLIHSQTDLLESTKKEYKRRIEELLGDGKED